MKSVKVESRRDPFVEKASTHIWHEQTGDQSGYLADSISCHGYALDSLLDKGYSLTDMIFLLVKGDLPTPSQRQLLNALSGVICNPGPRHPATRSVMEAAVSKTRTPHLLPIGLMVLGGDKAAGSVEAIMRFLRINRRKDLADFSRQLVESYEGPENDLEIAPGFGPCYEKRDALVIEFAESIRNKFKDDELSYLNWCLALDAYLANSNCGLKYSALAGAIFLDLGFHPRTGPALFQLLSAPGLLAHGLEMANKPLSAMPFVSDEHYHLRTVS